MPYPITVAEQILDEHIRSIEDLHFLEELAWERGAVVNYMPLRGADAWMSYAGRRPAIITVSSKIRSEERRRFSIAHELGHFEMHRFEYALQHCSRKDISIFGRAKDMLEPEDEANQFASALLLPERFVGNLCRESEPSFSLISDIAEQFRTSLEATARRLTGFSPEALAVAYCENGNIRRFKRSDAFREMGLFVRVGEAVDQRTSTFAMLDDHTAGIGSIWRDIPVEAWLRPGDFRRNATIKEQSIGMPNYNAALSLLWVDDDTEEDWL